MSQCRFPDLYRRIENGDKERDADFQSVVARLEVALKENRMGSVVFALVQLMTAQEARIQQLEGSLRAVAGAIAAQPSLNAELLRDAYLEWLETKFSDVESTPDYCRQLGAILGGRA